MNTTGAAVTPDSASTPSDAPFEFDVFISYSRDNSAIASALDRALRAYKPPSGLGLPESRLRVFLDVTDITGGNYDASIQRHLSRSKKLVVICSPASRGSDYVDQEIEIFAKVRGAQHIIPMLWEGLPNNETTLESESESAFPRALVDAIPMPLAIDYRGRDVRGSRVSKGENSPLWFSLLANCYDISRERIEQRELQRRRRTRNNWTIFLSAIGASLASLTVWALISAAEARRQAGISRAGELTARASTMKGADLESAQRRALVAAEAVARNATLGEHRRDAVQTMVDAVSRLPRLVLSFDFKTPAPPIVFSGEGQTMFVAKEKSIERWLLGAARLAGRIELDDEPTALIAGSTSDELAVIGSTGALEILRFSADKAEATRSRESITNVSCAAFNSEHTKLAVVVGSAKGDQEIQVRALPDLQIRHRLAIPAGTLAAADDELHLPCQEFSPGNHEPEILLTRVRGTDTTQTSGGLALQLPLEGKRLFPFDVKDFAPVGSLITLPSAKQTLPNIKQRVTRLVEEQISAERGKLDTSSPLQDLGLDELDVVKVCMAIKEDLKIPCPPEVDEYSVDDLVHLAEANSFRRNHPPYVRQWRDGERLQFITNVYPPDSQVRLLEFDGGIARSSVDDWTLHPDKVEGAVAVSRDGERFVSIRSLGEDPFVPLLDSKELEVRETSDGLIRAEVPGGGASSWQFSRDARALIAVHGSLVRYFSVNNTEENYRINARKAPVRVVEAPGSRFVALQAADGSLDVWDLAHVQEVARLPDTELVVLSANARRVAAVRGRLVEIIDREANATPLTLRFSGRPNAVRWSDDARYLALISSPHPLMLLTEPDLRVLTQVYDMDGGAKVLWSGEEVFEGVFHPDGNAILTIDNQGTVSMRRLPDAESAWHAQLPGAVRARFSRKGDVLAVTIDPADYTSTVERQIVLLDPKDGARITSIAGSYEFSDFDVPGKSMILAPKSGTPVIQAIGSGKSRPIALLPELDTVLAAGFPTANQMTVLASTQGGTFLGTHFAIQEVALRVDLQAGTTTLQLPFVERVAHDYHEILAQEDVPHLVSMRLSDDATHVGATVYASKRAYWQLAADRVSKEATVWDVRQPDPREVFRQPNAEVVAVTRGGNFVLTKNASGFTLWNIEPDGDFRRACRHLRRVPDPAQWKIYLDGEANTLSCP